MSRLAREGSGDPHLLEPIDEAAGSKFVPVLLLKFEVLNSLDHTRSTL